MGFWQTTDHCTFTACAGSGTTLAEIVLGATAVPCAYHTLVPFNRTAWPITLAVAAAAPFFAAMVSAKWHRPPQADWRSATTYLCSSDSRADAVFFSPGMAKFPFEYYLPQHPGCAPTVLPG